MLIRKVPGAVGVRPARSFVAASTQYLVAETGLGLGANSPRAVAVWARRATDLATDQTLVGIGTSGTLVDSHRLETLNGYDVSVVAQSGGAATNITSDINTFYAALGYRPIIAEWASDVSRRVIVNGTSSAYGTNGRTNTTAPNRITIAACLDATIPFDGVIAQVAIFAGAVSDALIAAHKRGIHPTQLPGNLLECWDLDRVGPIVGLVRGTVLSPVNGGGLAPGPMVQGPPTARRFFVKAPTGAPTNYTLAANAGTVTATPTNAVLAYLRTLVAMAASVLATGTNAVASLWRRLFGTTSTVETAAPTATGAVTRVITATPGTVDVTAPTATLTYSGASPPVRKTFMLMGVQK